MTTTLLRESRVVDRARALLGTSFRHQGRNPKDGLDWLGLIREATNNTKSRDMPGPYPLTFYTARSAILPDGIEPFLNNMKGWLNFKPIPSDYAEPGDVILFRIHAGDPINHAGVMARHDTFVHAPPTQSVRETRLIPWWQRRLAYSFKVTIS